MKTQLYFVTTKRMVNQSRGLVVWGGGQVDEKMTALVVGLRG